MASKKNPQEIEVAVISDGLINDAVLKEDPDPRNANAINENDNLVDFLLLQSLSLSYKNIFKIDNLLTLRDLVSLKLDNNVIHEIEGISHLKNLTWLDLSFNNISEIKGLETLTNLSDLTLFNNKITKLENMEQLKKLQVLSIGNNLIGLMENLLELRYLPKLEVLNLEGNPVCKDPEYRSYALAHFDKLKYLDYSLVETGEVNQAKEQYQDELEEYKEIKAIEDASKKREKENEEYTSRLRKANILLLETLFQDMFKEDIELSKVQALPGLQNLIDDYAEKVQALTEDIKPNLLENAQNINKECNQFEDAYQKVQESGQKRSIELSEEYSRKSKKFFKKAAIASEEDVLEILSDAETENEKLFNELMEIETDIVDECQELIEKLEENIETIASVSKNMSSEFFRSVEDLENNFFETVSQLAAHLLERMGSEEMEDDDMMTDECRTILNDRDAMNNAINGSHDIHIGKLLSQEDLINEQSADNITVVMKLIKDKHWKKNRQRVTEITNMKEKNENEIYELRNQLNHIDDDIE